MSYETFMSKVSFRKNGMLDCDCGTVSTDHPSCSYGIAVIVSDGQAFDPGDVQGGFVQAYGEQALLLKKAGFNVVEKLSPLTSR